MKKHNQKISSNQRGFSNIDRATFEQRAIFEHRARIFMQRASTSRVDIIICIAYTVNTYD